MEDVITDAPPPSRFFLEDLNIFSPPSPLLPSPFIVFSSDNLKKPLRPSMLLIAISCPSLHFVHNISSKTLIGSVMLPEISFVGNSIEDSLRNKSCNIYSIDDAEESIIAVSVQYPVTAERSHAIAKLLIGGQVINPERVLIFDSVRSSNFRGKLSRDEAFALKLETSSERNPTASNGDSTLIKGVDYFPSGSMVDGLGAALLTQCQLRKIKGTLCVSWPEYGVSVRSLVKSILLWVLPNVDLASVANHKDAPLMFNHEKVFWWCLHTVWRHVWHNKDHLFSNWIQPDAVCRWSWKYSCAAQENTTAILVPKTTISYAELYKKVKEELQSVSRTHALRVTGMKMQCSVPIMMPKHMAPMDIDFDERVKWFISVCDKTFLGISLIRKDSKCFLSELAGGK